MDIKESLSYDDLLLVPKFSEVSSRSGVDISVNIRNFRFKHPVVPANMKTIAGFEMARYCYKHQQLCILNRFEPLEEQIKWIKNIDNLGYPIENYIGFSIGIKDSDKEDLKKIFKELPNTKILCIDVAHGDSKMCVDMIKHIKTNYKDTLIIAGNVATGTGAERLWLAGADVVKCGVGGGSLCTTRIETGNGVAMITCLDDVKKSRDSLMEKIRGYTAQDLYIMADGGIKNAGDCVKALCFADMVMAGNVFAGTNECPGEIKEINGKKYKDYVGSSTHKTNHIEGVKSIMELKGPVKDVFTKLEEGIKSGCSYQGAENLEVLKYNPEFRKITQGGLRESYPHDVLVVK